VASSSSSARSSPLLLHPCLPRDKTVDAERESRFCEKSSARPARERAGRGGGDPHGERLSVCLDTPRYRLTAYDRDDDTKNCCCSFNTNHFFSLFSFLFFFFSGGLERERDGEIFEWRSLSGSRAVGDTAISRARLSARLIARRALIAVCKLRGGRGARDTDSLPLPLVPADRLFVLRNAPAIYDARLLHCSSRIACAFIYTFVAFTSRRR